MPVLDISSLEPNTNSELEASIPISFDNASSFALRQRICSKNRSDRVSLLEVKGRDEKNI